MERHNIIRPISLFFFIYIVNYTEKCYNYADLGSEHMNYSEALKEYRQKVLLTQEELAHELGVSFASVNRWERGLFEPTMKMKRKLKALFEKEGVYVNGKKEKQN